MKIKSNVKAGIDRGEGVTLNHNQTVKGFRVKSNVKAGALSMNHNQTVKGLRVRSNVKAGGKDLNHNQSITRAA
jgi:hypothetical protein